MTAPAGTSVTPSLSFKLWQPENPIFWMYVVLLTSGLIQFSHLLSSGLDLHPNAVMYGVILWSIYTIPWLIFINHRELFARESRRSAWVGFVWGGMIATWVMAWHANAAIINILSKTVGYDFSADWGPAIAAPIVEETSKALGIIVVILLVGRKVRSPYEGMILGAFVGLGFQVFEDMLYTMNAAEMNFGQNDFQAVWQVFVLRGIVGLFSHTFYTALVGAGIGFISSRRGPRRIGLGIAFIAAAVLMHSFWDSPLLGPAFFIKMVPPLILYIWVVRHALTSERAWVDESLQGEIAIGTITKEELDAIPNSYRDRRKQFKATAKADGKDAAESQRDFERAITNLADAVDDSDGMDTAEVEFARGEVARLRTPINA